MRFSELASRASLPQVASQGMLPPIAAFARIYPGYGFAQKPATPPPVGPAGQPLFDLGIGKYLSTHPAVIEAAITALKAGKTRYIGVPELKAGIVAKYADTGVKITGSEIKTIGGARMGITLAFMALLNKGDRVVIPDPDFIGLTHMAAALGADIVRPVTRDAAAGRFSADTAAVIQAIQPGTRLVAITNPVNPTGQVWKREELSALDKAAKAVGAVVFVNELYDKMVFGGRRHVSYFEVGDRANAIVVGGTAKAYNMTGFGCGWLLSGADTIAELSDLAFLLSLSSPDSPSQHAAAAALTAPLREEIPAEALVVLERNARMTCEALDGWQGCVCPMPEGGQFVYPYVGGDDVTYAERLKAEVGVQVIPGSSAGYAGRGHLRLTLGNTEEYQRDGLERMREGMARIASTAKK